MKPTTSVLGAIRLRLTTKKANKDYYKGASSVDPACLRLEYTSRCCLGPMWLVVVMGEGKG